LLTEFRNRRKAITTKRNLFIFTGSVLGIAVLARIIEPFTVPPGSEPGTSGLG